MQVMLSNEYFEIRKYQGRIVDLGFMTPESKPESKRYGTYRYIELLDLDDNQTITLENVVVGVRCASMVKEGAELTMIYGYAQDGESLNAVLATAASGQVKHDYGYLRSQIDLGLQLLRAKAKTSTGVAITSFIFSLPLMAYIFPGLVLLCIAFFSWRNRSRLLKAAKTMDKAIPTQVEFEQNMLSTV